MRQTDPERPSWVVAAALGSAACVALVLIALIAASLTVFGFGWVALALAAAVLAAFLTLPRLGPARALVAIAALTLPSVAVAANGLSLDSHPCSDTGGAADVERGLSADDHGRARHDADRPSRHATADERHGDTARSRRAEADDHRACPTIAASRSRSTTTRRRS